VGEILGSGVIVRPSSAPREPGELQQWTWICPGCGTSHEGVARECLLCNSALIDPDRVIDRDAQLRFFSMSRPGGALVAARRLG
jgi:hypothetical protein